MRRPPPLLFDDEDTSPDKLAARLSLPRVVRDREAVEPTEVIVVRKRSRLVSLFRRLLRRLGALSRPHCRATG